jgi:hypothetical protein
MNTLLGHFSVVVRSCKPLQPEGYEVTLELRRIAASNSPATPTTTESAPTSPAQESGGDDHAP